MKIYKIIKEIVIFENDLLYNDFLIENEIIIYKYPYNFINSKKSAASLCTLASIVASIT